MRVLVCGSRYFNDYPLLERTLDGLGFTITGLTHGAARGADTLGGMYAKARNIPCYEYPALWDKHGRAAGPIRNRQMLRQGTPDHCVAFLAPNSRGTKDMIEVAQKAGVPVTVVNI